MTARAVSETRCATDFLTESLRNCLAPGDGTAPPSVLLWTDGEGQWSELVVRLRSEFPWLFSLGEYAPENRAGPAIWLRCVVDRSLKDVWPTDAETPVLYLPRVERQQLRAGGDCPPELQPLVELQYRGAVWHQRNGRDWTVEAFLTSSEACSLEIAKDQLTKAAMMRVLPRLVDVPLDTLRGRRLIAEDFDKLAVPDAQRDMLLWLHDPSAFRASHDRSDWAAFCNLVKNRYGIDPEEDGSAEAARHLLEGGGQWSQLWQRFSEAPQRYRGISRLLREPLPGQGILVDRSRLPLENDEAENRLGSALASVTSMSHVEACERIIALEAEHGERRGWVWKFLDESPYADILLPLSRIAEVAKKGLSGSKLEQLATSYATEGWRCDDAALTALARNGNAVQHDLISGVLRAVYLPWLDQVARQFQSAVEHAGGSLPTMSTPAVEPGTCLLFVDGLRFDLAARLQSELESRSVVTRLAHRIGPTPSVTATAKPLASPVADLAEGDDATNFSPRFNDTKEPVSAAKLRERMAAWGMEILNSSEIGMPSSEGATGWIEVGRIDELGHKLGEDLPNSIDYEISRVRDAVLALLGAGWSRVRVVTDHGWLFMPGGLPKVELPHYLVSSRWARCAAVREGAIPQIPTHPWFWNSSIRIASPPGAGAYVAGTRYTHGGLSPQECVVPELIAEQSVAAIKAKITSVEWKRLRCIVSVTSNDASVSVDVRSNWKQPVTSLVIAPKTVGENGTVNLAVRDEFEGQSVMVVLLDPRGEILDKRSTTVGGD